MGVFIGVMVLVLSFALVVLLALSEWFDFDLGTSTRQAVATVSTGTVKAPAKRRTAKPKRRS